MEELSRILLFPPTDLQRNQNASFVMAMRGAMVVVLENEELRTLAWMSGPSTALRDKLLVQFRTFLNWKHEQERRQLAKRAERARAKAKAKAKGKAAAKANAKANL